MRLISKFKDYYDSFFWGEEPPYFIRTETVYDKNMDQYPFIDQAPVLFFCGKSYPFYQDYKVSIWTFEDFAKKFPFYKTSYFRRQYGKNYFRVEEDYSKINLQYKSPIVLWDGYKIIVNPRLNQYNFQKVMPPYQTYQEIEMFMNGPLTNPGNPMIELSDKSKIKKHGFDVKTSFRKGKNERTNS